MLASTKKISHLLSVICSRCRSGVAGAWRTAFAKCELSAISNSRLVLKATIFASAIGFFVTSQTALAGTVSVTFDQNAPLYTAGASASDVEGSDREEQNLRARAKLLLDQFASDICSFASESEQGHFAVSLSECGLSVPEIVFLPIESISRPNVLAGVYEIDGAFKVFFVEDYYSSLSPRLIDQLLIEELSHVARWNSTFGGDSADFGAEVAAKLLGAREF